MSVSSVSDRLRIGVKAVAFATVPEAGRGDALIAKAATDAALADIAKAALTGVAGHPETIAARITEGGARIARAHPQSPVSRLPAGNPGGRKIAAAAFRRLAFEPAYGNAADGATFQNLLFAKGETEVMNGTVEIEDTGHPKSRRERQSSHP